MNILEIINEACLRNNEPAIQDAFSTANNQSKMYLASAKKMARDIAKRYLWGDIVVPASFTTVVGVQDYRLPCDYKEILTNDLYNSTQQLAIAKETGDMAQAYISTGNTTWTDTRYRIIQGKFRFTVPADTEDVIRYEYKSKYLSCLEGVGEEIFTDNDSEFVLDDEALIKAIVFDISRKYGFEDTAVLKAEYEEELTDLITKEGGKFVIAPTGDFKKYPYPSRWNREGDVC